MPSNPVFYVAFFAMVIGFTVAVAATAIAIGAWRPKAPPAMDEFPPPPASSDYPPARGSWRSRRRMDGSVDWSPVLEAPRPRASIL